MPSLDQFRLKLWRKPAWAAGERAGSERINPTLNTPCWEADG